jgi:hypothetical protein
MNQNINPETGIRFGIISTNSLHSDVIEEIQSRGVDVRYEEMRKDLWAEVKNVCKDYMSDSDAKDVADYAIDYASENFYDDEPIHEFAIGGVKGRTTWLGGALLVWIFESPFTTHAQLCSPCVPNCGDLDHLMSDEGGYLCYDVPPDWRDNS